MEQRTYLTPEERRATSRDIRPLEVKDIRNDDGILIGYKFREVRDLQDETGVAVRGTVAPTRPDQSL